MRLGIKPEKVPDWDVHSSDAEGKHRSPDRRYYGLAGDDQFRGNLPERWRPFVGALLAVEHKPGKFIEHVDSSKILDEIVFYRNFLDERPRISDFTHGIPAVSNDNYYYLIKMRGIWLGSKYVITHFVTPHSKVNLGLTLTDKRSDWRAA